MYRINLHAHTIFSDGHNSPYVMALRAKELGFSALVITDHYYGHKSEHGLSKLKYKLLRIACSEAKKILPVITGIEYSYGNEEILIFGSGMIKEILHCHEGTWLKRKISVKEMLEWKHKYNGACILCHPSRPKHWKYLRPLLDGFERYNSGADCFARNRAFCSLQDLPRWCNSDAHGKKVLNWAFNVTNSKITTESQLIKYIKSGKQPELYKKKIEG